MNLAVESAPALVWTSQTGRRSMPGLPTTSEPTLSLTKMDVRGVPPARPSARRSNARPARFVDLLPHYRAAVHLVPDGPAIWSASEELVARARRGLEEFPPQLMEDGEGGTYLLLDETGEALGIFKPQDEEPFSIGNPKNRVPGTPQLSTHNAEIKQGIRSGEAAQRELAAFLLDHGHRADVPLTAMVELGHPMFGPGSKIGSLQQFIAHECQSWDLGPTQYAASNVHAVGLLDLRIFNVDRHGGNILVQRCASAGAGNKKPSFVLRPIDHGFALPDSPAAPDLWFEWMTWPQAKQPFDEEILAYVKSIDLDADIRLLRALGIRDQCIGTLVLATTLVKKACARGMTLYDLGLLVTRRDPARPSALEDAFEHQLLTDTRSRYFVQSLAQPVEDALDRAGKPSHDRPHHQRNPSLHLRSQLQQQKRLVVPAPLRRTSSALPCETGTAVTDPFFAQCQSYLIENGSFLRRNMSHENMPTLPTLAT